MARNVVESIFNSKNNLNDFYPNKPGVKDFDLHRKHMFYGRIDKNSDAIYLDTPGNNLKQIYAGRTRTLYAVDFVSEAFADLKMSVNRAGNAQFIDRNSLYKTKMRAHKAWDSGDLNTAYTVHIDGMYTNFVNSYLSIDRRREKIKNYRDFVKEFLRYSLRIAADFPVTRTGFITSVHCSPFASGLMVEIANENHGVQHNAKVIKYVNDPNFFFFVNEAKKFGFMIDKNAPWRLVFNLASGAGLDPSAGGQIYLNRKGVSFDNVLETYYRKAYLDEFVNIRNKFAELYSAFYAQYNTYEAQSYVKCVDEQNNYNLKVISSRKEREIPLAPTINGIFNPDMDDYWLKILLKLRLAETKFPHDAQNYNFYADKIIDAKRIFGLDAALSEINELTKGFRVTTFNTKGDYWHGVSRTEYERRKHEAKQHADNPSLVNYSITGTKNIQ